jgi:hypothetical protein
LQVWPNTRFGSSAPVCHGTRSEPHWIDLKV